MRQVRAPGRARRGGGTHGYDPVIADHPLRLPAGRTREPGDLFDATEIDEIDSAADPRHDRRGEARHGGAQRASQGASGTDRGIDRSGHGETARHAARSSTAPQTTEPPPTWKPELAFLHAGGRDLAVGDSGPSSSKSGADIFDLVLKDELAVIEAIERDFDDKVDVAVVLDADRAEEIGLDRMPGARFFFSPDELSPWERRADHEPNP